MRFGAATEQFFTKLVASLVKRPGIEADPKTIAALNRLIRWPVAVLGGRI
jgi:hypothetical protein